MSYRARRANARPSAHAEKMRGVMMLAWLQAALIGPRSGSSIRRAALRIQVRRASGSVAAKMMAK